MKVYLVFEHLFDEHFGSSTDYCGVFSTRENAESWIKRNEYYGSHFEIKEDSLDERKLYNIFEYYCRDVNQCYSRETADRIAKNLTWDKQFGKNLSVIRQYDKKGASLADDLTDMWYTPAKLGWNKKFRPFEKLIDEFDSRSKKYN